MESTVTSKGRITLPKPLREALHLNAGDKVLFEVDERGTYTLRPKTLGVESLKGFLNYTGPARTLDEIEAAITKRGSRKAR